MKKIFLAFVAFSSISFQVIAQWVEVTPPIIGDDYSCNLSVVSPQTAFVFSRSYSTDSLVIGRTTDGGITWENKYLPDWADTLGWQLGGRFASNEFGYVYGTRNHHPNYFTDGIWLLKTTDSGNTWQEISLPVSFAYHLNVLHFFDSERGVLVVGTSLSTIYQVFTTQDGGQTWTEHTPLNRRINEYCFKPDGFGIGFATYSYPNHPPVLTTSDFGASWVLHDTADVNVNWIEYKKLMFGFGNQYFINDTIGYSYYVENTGPYLPKFYHLTKTTDGGNTWLSDGLILYASPFLEMEGKEGILWVLTDKFLFHNGSQSSGTKVANTKEQVRISPNPIQGSSKVQLKMSDSFSGRAEVQILQTSGFIAQQMTTVVFEGESTLLLENLPAGIYFVTVKLENQGTIATGKLVVY